LDRSSQIQELTPAELITEHRRGTLILDTRPAEQFAALHIRGSIQISLLGHFAAWAAMLLDPASQLVLISEDETHARESHDRLLRVGIAHVIGYSRPNEHQWREHGLDLASIPVQRCGSICGAERSDTPLQLIDVRSRAEWLKGHLPGAVSLPLLDIESNIRAIDPSKPSLIYCHEGFRATTAASIVLRESDGQVGILIDGIEGWLASGLPLEMPGAK
jgi:rhodanese-related sulfurtransferase